MALHLKRLLFRFLMCLVAIWTTFSYCEAQRGTRGMPILTNEPEPGEVYALVIGISEYQNVQSLEYADDDAIFFADFLKSEAGGALDSLHIKVLLNKEATTGRIDAGFGWLSDNTKAGDIAIIYFCGHGDVETRTSRQNGYLLSYDSPAQVYIAGAIPVSYLNDFVSTLSEQNTQIILITDACRSGKLAGGIEGAKQTSSMLMKQWSNEIKILSCQAGELSQEGKRWGGGRGVFSYYLVDGMQGLADQNQDSVVTLAEIYSYLVSNVSAETQPMEQNPVVYGKMQTVMCKVDYPALEKLINTRKKDQEILAPVDLRGLDIMLLSTLDSSIARQYKEFEKAIEEGRLTKPAGNSAWDYYQLLIGNQEAVKLHGLIRRNLAAAFQDNAQQVINQYLAGKRTSLDLLQCNYNAELLTKTAGLIGEKHFLYNSIRAKCAFFEALSIQFNAYLKNDTLGAGKVIAKLKECISIEPAATYAYNELGCLYQEINCFDSAIVALNQAVELSPSWVFPYINLGIACYHSDQKTKAIAYFEKARMLDSSNVMVYINLGTFYSELRYHKK
ncbi:MAG: caspase family protein, partial [Bacteroidetes bacterium]|nr:caspase family protein [Bacteroidota bacterium]